MRDSMFTTPREIAPVPSRLGGRRMALGALLAFAMLGASHTAMGRVRSGRSGPLPPVRRFERDRNLWRR